MDYAPLGRVQEYESEISICTLSLAWIILQFIPPFEHPLVHLEGLDYPHLSDIVPTWLLFLLMVAVPLSICYFFKQIKPFLLGLVVVLVLTDALKLMAGRMRPDFLDRCQLKNGACTGDLRLVQNGRKSWPSGHTSLSFYSTCFLGQLLTKYKILGWTCLLLLASWVSISRIEQHVHHPTDVASGCLLGIGVAFTATHLAI
ncbi:phosphatidic acid phosphatase type 2/haloperoxidase [Gorgonomyces haynaldii]|nr:phosphatidic acid phosphatase type 2/haloperoxidase [Gorgonomyces haynaldii]